MTRSERAAGRAWTRSVRHVPGLRVTFTSLLVAVSLVLFCSASEARIAAKPRGPLVAVPHCSVVSEGCSLDPATPDLDPAGCALTLAKQLERRGVRAEVIGPGAVVCGEGSRALILEGNIQAQCPGRAQDEAVMDQVLAVSLAMELVLKDCFSGETIGRGRSERAIESGRRALVRDSVEELAHHTSETDVRRLYPETPVRWIRADVGGEKSIEVFGGFVDVEESGINDFLGDAGIDTEDTALRGGFEVAYNPWSAQATRIGVGAEIVEVESRERGGVDLADLGRNPANHPGFDPNGPHDVEMVLRVLGIRGSVAQGFDFTLNQRVSLMGTIGHYTLGHVFTPSEIRIEGLPGDSDELRKATLMLSAEVRYEWRVTPHVGLSLAGGYNYLEFSEPNRLDRRAPFPYDLDFSGTTARIALAGRF